MTDKKKGVPTPKTKKLTKSQATLLDTVIKEAEEGFRNIVNVMQLEMNKHLMARVERHITDFREELNIPDDWEFNDQTKEFKAKE